MSFTPTKFVEVMLECWNVFGLIQWFQGGGLKQCKNDILLTGDHSQHQIARQIVFVTSC